MSSGPIIENAKLFLHLTITISNLCLVKLIQLHRLLQGEEMLGFKVTFQGTGDVRSLFLHR